MQVISVTAIMVFSEGNFTWIPFTVSAHLRSGYVAFPGIGQQLFIFQKPNEELDVVWRPWDPGVTAEIVQESGTKGSTRGESILKQRHLSLSYVDNLQSICYVIKKKLKVK